METINGDIKERRKRGPNWEDSERSLLIKCVTSFLEIIENKNTDTQTNKRKAMAWKRIEARFNIRNIRKRAIKELRQQWRVIKMKAYLKTAMGSDDKARGNEKTIRVTAPMPNDVNILSIRDDIIVDVEKCQVKTEIIDDDDEEEDIDNDEIEDDINKIQNEHMIMQNDQNQRASEPYEIEKDMSEVKNEKIDFQVTEQERNESTPSDATDRDQSKDEAGTILEICKERNAMVLKYMKVEHEVKMLHLAETHQWAREQHMLTLQEQQLKIENIRLQNRLLEKQLK